MTLDPAQLKELEETLKAEAYEPGTSRDSWSKLMGAAQEVKRVRLGIEYRSAGGRLHPSPVGGEE